MIYLRPSCFLNAFKDFAIIGATPVGHKQANMVVNLAHLCHSFKLSDRKIQTKTVKHQYIHVNVNSLASSLVFLRGSCVLPDPAVLVLVLLCSLQLCLSLLSGTLALKKTVCYSVSKNNTQFVTDASHFLSDHGSALQTSFLRLS